MRTILILTVCALCIAGCASEMVRSWPEINGRVLDAENEAPIEGAIVNVYTHGIESMVIDSQSVCYHIDATVTDIDGMFKFPAWNEGLVFSSVGSKHWTVRVFKPGYIESIRTNREQSQKEYVWYQRKFQGTREEWFSYLRRMYMSTSCGNAGQAKIDVLPVLEAVLRDAEQLASTGEEVKFVRWLQHHLGKIRKE